MKTCKGCEHLVREEFPKGAAVLRCMHDGPRKGRTVDYSPRGEFTAVVRPAWCEKGENNERIQ